MGYFLLFEGMLNSVLVAKRNLCSPDAVILPQRALIHIAAVTSDDTEAW